MPRYTVQSPSGRTVVLEGDDQPTEQDLDEIFSNIETTKPTRQSQEPSTWQKLSQIPASANRAFLMGIPEQGISPFSQQAYSYGAMNPNKISSIQSTALERFAPKTSSTAINFVGGLPVSATGLAADIATDPLAMLAGLITGTQTGRNVSGLNALANTRTGQAVSQFVNKPIQEAGKDVAQLFKIEGKLQKAQRAKDALDTVRTTLGKAKDLAIQQVADEPTNLSFGTVKSDRLFKAITNPIYDVRFNEDKSLVQTVANLDKTKTAVGELIHTPKIWEEAPNTELRQVKQFYGIINNEMKSAARNAGRPIDEALNAYHEFMKHYYFVNKTLVDSAGNAMGNKLAKTFEIRAEPAYKEAWKEVSNYSPELKGIMNQMSRKELLRNLLIYGGGGGISLGIGGKFLKKLWEK